jgi:hypothetical protein
MTSDKLGYSNKVVETREESHFLGEFGFNGLYEMNVIDCLIRASFLRDFKHSPIGNPADVANEFSSLRFGVKARGKLVLLMDDGIKEFGVFVFANRRGKVARSPGPISLLGNGRDQTIDLIKDHYCCAPGRLV